MAYSDVQSIRRVHDVPGLQATHVLCGRNVRVCITRTVYLYNDPSQVQSVNSAYERILKDGLLRAACYCGTNNMRTKNVLWYTATPYHEKDTPAYARCVITATPSPEMWSSRLRWV